MRRIWAVATNTIAQAVRMKIAAVFIVLLLILLPLMSLIITGDGSLKGKLQTFVSYGLSLTSLLLCLLTIIISIYSLSSDIKQCQIWTVVTKPIRRFELLCGKLLGVVILDATLLFCFASIIYGLTMLVPNLTRASAEEIEQAQNEFFTARASIKPLLPDVTKETYELFNKLKEQGQIPEQMTARQAFQQLYQAKLLEKHAVPPGNQIRWQFDDIGAIDPNSFVFVRFKYDVSVTPPGLQIYGKWYIGDDRQFGQGVSGAKNPIYVVDQPYSIRTIHEIAVPANAVVDGYLGVVFENVASLNNTVVIFPTEDGLEILYKAGSFGDNFIRATLLIFMRLVFLAVLGISVATWLSFPVAILLCLVIFFSASISGFILESFDGLEGGIGAMYGLTIRPLLSLLPQFDALNPSTFIVGGQLLNWQTIAWAAIVLLLIKAMIVWLVGILIFTYKEIAKVTV
ncbi:MAG: hypothetical protein Q7T18_09695 [Sedimentisphaerales bacterium]|nr:hypothetical protein [Sedimentisphaerales bacterium]